ncbi:uncharacterized protein LOC130689291 [Daphnia carinata]|uniref:uncharacterized protein LOC130689291 n=1 Tax=Daphnia carinata TaxID=120202 RepID=UPI002579F2CE|nr:uncharacterized protein LOC130689291 [Daphnia carinata]
MAQQRLRGLLKRFDRDPAFETDYRVAMKKTIDKGYASIHSEEEAACFLWQDPAASKTLVCRMNRLPFGATCSPFIAIHTTRWAAMDAEVGEEIANAVKTKMYVDDYLGSATTVDEAVKEAATVRKALAAADLHFQKWISNSVDFVREMHGRDGPSVCPPSDLQLADSGSEKVLGVVWNFRDDTLGFRVNCPQDEEYTRISLTSKVASVFDPLGIAAPFVVKAKIRLQELGIKGLNWSDPVDENDRAWWDSWFTSLRELVRVSIPRCLFSEQSEIGNSQLHVFGDAPEEAYAAVVYLRNAYRSGSVQVRMVKASSKLAPKKTLSVPMLELNVALLSSRIAAAIHSSLTHPIQRRFFWTDSSTVRNWIRATASFYQVFVSNRIGEIQTLTETEEWRFVPGRQNPADATPRCSIGDRVFPKSWQDGPEVLFKAESEWPQDLPWMAATLELKHIKQYHVRAASDPFDWSEFQLDKTNLSSFLKLEGDALELVKRCQMEAFFDEIQSLQRGKPLPSASHLLSLSPTIGEDGLLRLGGRIERSKLPYDNRHPPLLPNKHPLTEKIVKIVHEEMHHAGTDYLFAKLCQHFWIIRGREVAKKIRRLCPSCIRERAVPAAQMMGDLPAFRLNSFSPPFTHTAVDYFGPLKTSPGRNRVLKRYGALFTCLVTRAVHLELAESLSSEDFLLVFRRFIGLFGKPASVHSDNGTNFVGAERELNDLVQNRRNFSRAVKSPLNKVGD